MNKRPLQLFVLVFVHICVFSSLVYAQQSPPLHPNRVLSIAWSPDGSRIANSNARGVTTISNPSTNQVLLTLQTDTTGPTHSVAWSPDGTRIATAGYDGAIRIQDAQTGNLLQAYTMPSGWAIYQLDWSPDSTHIVTGDESGEVIIWTLATNQIATLIDTDISQGRMGAPVMSVSWRPTGTHVAVVSISPYAMVTAVRIYDTSTYQLTKFLVIDDEGSAERVAWSPDGDRLLLTGYTISAIINYNTEENVVLQDGGIIASIAWNPDGSQVASVLSNAIRIWDANSGQIAREIPTGSDIGSHVMAWSPDGTRIAAGIVSGSVKVWDVLTGELLATYADADAGYGPVAWSPNGNQLAYSSVDETVSIVPAPASTPSASILFASERDGNWELYTMQPDGSGLTRLTHHAATDFTPAWSPNRSRIAFASDRDGNFEVYVMNADGSNPIRLTNHPAADGAPAWSPDGSKIAFTSYRDDNTEIYVMNADGSGLMRVTADAAEDGAPAWSPDGTTLAFSSTRAGNADIYSVDLAGTLMRLTSSPADDVVPVWSPDGSRLAFVSNRDGSYELYAMNADGSSPIRLTDNPAADGFDFVSQFEAYYGLAWSPDGTRLVFLSDRDGNLELYALDGAITTRLTTNAARDAFPDW